MIDKSIQNNANFLSHFIELPAFTQLQLSDIFSNYHTFSQNTGILSHCLLTERWLINCILDTDNNLLLEWKFPFAWQYGFKKMQEDLNETLINRLGLNSISWRYSHAIEAFNINKSIKSIKHILAVSSGKGGVGKSSVTVNLAAALTKQGAKVGVLDADIYGPSIPTMFGTEGSKLTSPDGQHMQPIMAYNIATNSIGYLSSEQNAMIWRGPMASKALIQLLEETLWPDLDYLIIDMPPGTGDIQITLGQKIPLSSSLIVTTPQDIALIDARKGIKMFNDVNVPILGIIENMSWHICSNCGHAESIFGVDGAHKLSSEFAVELLGQIPLHISVREDLDAGCPTVIAREETDVSVAFLSLSEKISALNYLKCKSMTEKHIAITQID
ncbi:iron-sulfur cluster carrier protein ApbC [Thorsellia anophelis]|uniref:Iron-sulfur cluster carrier protein n=1 Tax=Thorsellia anophelis DSM 18579 TaxID=1123402 RepID=A0A1I0BZF6_9GAMM|nr:iron-sulfur cluster carrier protein ApbC [Thorsellia anophelis]SET12462.1 ATP-binding protein involved in chromosome partitioning [Thorsellia anophelis DSM 18579]